MTDLLIFILNFHFLTIKHLSEIGVLVSPAAGFAVVVRPSPRAVEDVGDGEDKARAALLLVSPRRGPAHTASGIMLSSFSLAPFAQPSHLGIRIARAPVYTSLEASGSPPSSGVNAQ